VILIAVRSTSVERRQVSLSISQEMLFLFLHPDMEIWIV
jgi:hypothetical protein